MKQALLIAILFFFGCDSVSQKNEIRGNKFYLKGEIVGEVELTAYCGFIAWGTVIEFEIEKLIGMNYANKTIRLIITCPGDYEKNYFEIGKAYNIIFSDKNQASFKWLIRNKELLKKNSLPFEPYVVEIKKIP